MMLSYACMRGELCNVLLCMFKAQRPEACMGRSMSSLGYAGNLFEAIRLEPIVAEDFKCA